MRPARSSCAGCGRPGRAARPMRWSCWLQPTTRPRVLVVGPQDSRPVRELPASHVLDLLNASRGSAAREAASFLAREFSRLEESVIPGLRVKDLLTPHFVARAAAPGERTAARRNRGRRPRPRHAMALPCSRNSATGLRSSNRAATCCAMARRRSPSCTPIATRRSLAGLPTTENCPKGWFWRTANGTARFGACWRAEGRYRLFQRRPPVGAATGQYIEIDTGELEREARLYLGLLAPESLREGGWLTGWVEDAKDFGEELRKGLEERLIKDALPNIARGPWRASRIARR